MKKPQTQLLLNSWHLKPEEIMSRPVSSSSAPPSITGNFAIDATDLNETATFKRLLDSLIYALAIDDTFNLSATLGMVESISNQEALSIWVKNETHGIQFLDASALFTFLFKQLDNLVVTIRRTQ
jgi:hypothetical protein